MKDDYETFRVCYAVLGHLLECF